MISKSVRVFYLELSPFAVKAMFWFSLLANEITGNFISSSGCGPDWLAKGDAKISSFEFQNRLAPTPLVILNELSLNAQQILN